MTKLNLASLKKQNLSSILAIPKIEPISIVPESTRPKVSLTQFRREREVKEEGVSTPELVNPLIVESSSLEITSLSTEESSPS